MTLLSAVLLAVIQGITEFLPISSSGHLVLAQHLIQFSEPPISYDLLLHLGTQLSVIVFFRKQIWSLIRSLPTSWKDIILPLVFVTMPIVVVGLLFADYIKGAFHSIGIISITFLVTATLLLSTKYINRGTLKSKWLGLKWPKALVIGLFQSIALLPGVSRSGATIVGGMRTGLKPKQAFEFAFFAGLISIVGASTMDLMSSEFEGSIGGKEIVGFFIAGIVGYGSLIIVNKVVKTGKFWFFGIYCLVMSVVSGLIWLL